MVYWEEILIFVCYCEVDLCVDYLMECIMVVESMSSGIDILMIGFYLVCDIGYVIYYVFYGYLMFDYGNVEIELYVKWSW